MGLHSVSTLTPSELLVLVPVCTLEKVKLICTGISMFSRADLRSASPQSSALPEQPWEEIVNGPASTTSLANVSSAVTFTPNALNLQWKASRSTQPGFRPKTAQIGTVSIIRLESSPSRGAQHRRTPAN